MATYKPVAVSITSASIAAKNGKKIEKSAVNVSWNLVFIYGTALFSTSVTQGVLSNATVLGWYSTQAGSMGDADLLTFTDANGRYGITMGMGNALTLKFYSNADATL